MKIPELSKSGLCRDCGWMDIEDGTDWLPGHSSEVTEGECRHAGMSPEETKYVIKTEEEALTVATFIKDDDGGCLEHGRSSHSLACGDGEHCEGQRLLLSKALAQYWLDKYYLVGEDVELPKISDAPHIDDIYRDDNS